MMKKLVVGAAAVLLSLSALGACSSSDWTPATPPADAGVDRQQPGPPAVPPAPPSPPPDAGETAEQCNARCEAQHPAGLVLDKKIDDCWNADCKGPCVDGMGGFDAGTDAGDGGDGGGVPACQNTVDTSDVTCDLCTKTYCCVSWDACFNDKDCTDLNDCRSNCPP
jgi:hypothetical protein